MKRHVISTLVAATLVASGNDKGPGVARSSATQPDELPVPVSANLPFRYPPSLYARKVQGNALPRLYSVSVISPVNYRHPDAPPLPNDTILKQSKP